MTESQHHRFSHEAMTTPFEIKIAGENKEYARQAAQEVFKEIDRIETLLSCYIDSSDISRINSIGAAEPVRVSIETMECLKLAMQAFNETGGAFDVTVGAITDKKNSTETKKHSVGMQYVDLNDKEFTVRLKREGIRLDLGGIGKGFALDAATELLEDWSIESAFLSAGGSTVLALNAPPDKPGWKVSVGAGTPDMRETMLKNRALSGSGTAIKGQHIIDPKTGRPPSKAPFRTWASCPSAAMADALSTAFMIMSQKDIEAYCKKHSVTWAAYMPGDTKKKSIKFLSKWSYYF